MRAHKLYNAGNYKQALELCSSVYERNSLRTDNLLLLGAIYYQVMRFVVVEVVNGAVSVCVFIKWRFCFCCCLKLHDYDMCIAKNEEALRIEPHFAECYGNMANAWKVCNCGLRRMLNLILMLWFE